MKKITPITILGLIILLGLSNSLISSSSGSPQGHTGSEASNNRTCATSGCHSGGPAISAQDATLTTDIPASGFEPNTTYNFTLTANSNGASHPVIGFSASVEDGNGDFLGTLISSNNTTNVNGQGTYITHTFSSRTAGATGQSWSFEWNSGTTTDTAIVYAAVNFANGDGGRNGDAIYSTSFTLISQSSSVITGQELAASLTRSPNPVYNFLNLTLENLQARKVNVALTDMNGKTVFTEQYLVETSRKTIQVATSNLAPGMYILAVAAGNKSFHERIIVN